MIDSRLFFFSIRIRPVTNRDDSIFTSSSISHYSRLFFLSHCLRFWSLSMQYVQINTWNETSDSFFFFHHLFDHRWRQLRSFLLTIVSGHNSFSVATSDRRTAGIRLLSFISCQTWKYVCVGTDRSRSVERLEVKQGRVVRVFFT